MTSPYSAVVFAGGGSRCFWQLGFWAEAAPALGLAPRTVAGVSAGAAIAAAILAGCGDRALSEFKKATARNARNMYLGNILRREPVFPHERMYRDAILTTIDKDALRRLKDGPDLRVLLARPPARLGSRFGVLVGILCYELEKRVSGGVHAALARRIGFTPEVVSAQTCDTPDDLADLILHSSCIPPVTSVLQRDGRSVIDGGLVDNVPLIAVEGDHENDEILILLTRRYRQNQVPRIQRLTYVQPSEQVEISKFDYANPEGLQKTFDLGRKDGERFVRETQRAD